ncbi:MAG: hypothetical protein ABI167_10265 [Nitrosospira sp.]
MDPRGGKRYDKMDYSRFRFRAVVDWIEIEIRTATFTNVPKMRRSLKDVLGIPDDQKSPFAGPLDEVAGGAATIYRFKIHDPRNWHEITRILEKLSIIHELAAVPRVTAIEIALDAFCKDEIHSNELANIAVNYYWGMTQPVSNNRRIYHSYRGSGEGLRIVPARLTRHIREGWQIGIGNALNKHHPSDDYYQHIYLKTTDNNKKALPKDQHRARIELTIREKAGPCQTEEAWHSYDFSSISPFFKFRKLKEDLKLNELELLLLNSAYQIGEKKKRKRREGGTYLYGKKTCANAVLNEKASQALRNLTCRWKTK